MKKKLFSVLLSVAMVTSLLAGCGSTAEAPAAEEAAAVEETAEAPAAEEPVAEEPAAEEADASYADIKAVLILPGSISDQGWNASNYNGVMACNEQIGSTIEYVESVDEADFESTFRNYAERGYNLIFAAGNQFDEAAKAVAPSYPDTTFSVVNGVNADSDNMAPIFVKEYEGAYLAGIIAGELSETGKFATMGGFSNAAMLKLLDVYEGISVETATAKGIADASATRAFLDSWTDATKGKQMTESMIDNGSDVVFCYANEGALGSIEAAKSKGAKFIGFAGDKTTIDPETVVASIDEDYASLYVWAMEQYTKGELKGYLEAGIAENVFVPIYTDAISDDIKAKVTAGIDDVTAGKVDLTQYFVSEE